MGARLRLLVFPITALLALVPVVFSAQNPPANPEPPPGTPEPPVTPPAPSEPKTAAMKRAMEWKQSTYTCEGGTKLKVYLYNDMAKVAFKDKVYLMKQTRSADGGRYSDGKVVWWGKGNGGFLQVDGPDGNGAMVAKGCALDKPMYSEAAPGKVSGTVSYLVRMALPPNAVIEVKLQDVSRADASAAVVSEEKIALGERQVPVPFELRFDPAKIDPNNTYSVSARILVDGQLRFSSDKSYAVLTRGNPAHVEMMLKQAGAPGVPATP